MFDTNFKYYKQSFILLLLYKCDVYCRFLLLKMLFE